MTDLDTILAARRTTHGDYGEHAACTQALKRICHEMPGWQRLSDDQRETLEMINHKVGRILAGDPDFPDHWADIAGYAKLTADRLAGGEGQS